MTKKRSSSSSRLLPFFALLFVGVYSGAEAMTFRTFVLDGHPAIVAVGAIAPETPAEFARLRTEPGTSVFIDSPGGNVGAAVQLGSLFRRRGIDAVIAGVTETGRPTAGACYSACVYALVGALHRSVPGRSRVGIHRMRANFEVEGIDPAASELARRAAERTLMSYAASMGVDPSMIASAEETPSDSMRLLTPGELQRWRVANR